MAFMTSKEQADMELSLKLRKEGQNHQHQEHPFESVLEPRD